MLSVTVTMMKTFRLCLRLKFLTLQFFGKTWDLHVTEALKIELDQNLELINDSLSYLKTKVDRAFYDAEHFF